jgi:hypothetical protein
MDDFAPKHTPGPWTLTELPLSNDGDLEPSFRIEGETTLFLTVSPCSDGYRPGENEANARLIAAAPDLLAVLERLLVAVEPVRFHLRKDIDRQVEAKKEWAKKVNNEARHSSEMWTYSTEFRLLLEQEIEPFITAIQEANRVYDRVVATIETKEVADE